MSYLAWTVALLVLVTTATQGSCNIKCGTKPHIFILMSDDIGWCDYEFCDESMATPSIKALAEKGVTLNQSYTLQTCTPTRTALLTGRYPFTIGMQAGKVKGTAKRWLNESLTLMPATLKTLGYATHAVGKWHLGFCHWKLTPTFRGFDTFYGFLSGEQGYFTHSGKDNVSFDFRDNYRLVWEAKGKYSTELHTSRVQEIIRNRTKEPLFVYMAFQNAHAPWQDHPRYTEKYCSHVVNETRRIHCSMVAAMDEGIGNITQTLIDEGIFDCSFIVYLSDNGGAVGYGSYNWPLRGRKSSFWEGGVRSYTVVVYPKMLKKVNTTWDQLVHVTDWYTTFVSAAKGNVTMVKEELGLDGYDHLRGMRFLKKKGDRDRMIINIDDRRNRSAVRIGDLKLLRGMPGSLKYSGWVPPPYLAARGAEETKAKRKDVTYWQLYDVRKDPEERYNLINNANYSKEVTELKEFMEQEAQKLVPFPINITKEPFGNPKYWQEAWSPGWCCLD